MCSQYLSKHNHFPQTVVMLFAQIQAFYMSKKNHDFCLAPFFQSKFKLSECKSIQAMYIWLFRTSQYTHTFQVRSLAQSAYTIIPVLRFETDPKVSKLPEYYLPSSSPSSVLPHLNPPPRYAPWFRPMPIFHLINILARNWSPIVFWSLSLSG